jgi:hypothetical protein
MHASVTVKIAETAEFDETRKARALSVWLPLLDRCGSRIGVSRSVAPFRYGAKPESDAIRDAGCQISAKAAGSRNPA